MQNNTFSTLFIGQNYIKLNRVDSTNNFLKEILSKSEPLAEGTVIMADHQFAGRGQQQNVWESMAYKNLTFSIFLKPNTLSAEQQFYLNMCVCIGVKRAFKALYDINIDVKWPNDIYYNHKKMGGILIENTLFGSTIKQTIIGIGLNINQTTFEESIVDKAISLHQILQKDVELFPLMAEICSHIEALYLKLRTKQYAAIKTEYLECLYRFGTKSLYRQNGNIFEGIITDVKENGILMLTLDGEVKPFNFKEIEFLNH